MGLTVIPGQCPPRRHGDVHRDSSGQPGLTRRTPDLPAPGTGVSQQRSQLNGHTTRDIRRSGCFASSFPRKPPSRIVERSVRVRTAVDTCSSCARNRRYAGDLGPPTEPAHALFVTVGHSRPDRGVKQDGRQTGGCRRQPVFGPRAGARADVTAPGPGCRRDGWPGCCGQHKSNTSPGPGGIQHADNTYKTAFPGTLWHGC
jgi:hypothetical protein